MDSSPNWQAPDKLLQGLLALVNKGGLHFKITLIVNGTLFSGAVISARNYTTALEQIFASSIDTDDTSDNLLNAVKQITNKLYQPLAKENSADEGLLEFIHLTDVYCYANDINFSGHPFPYWRVRLSDVDGWMMGG